MSACEHTIFTYWPSLPYTGQTTDAHWHERTFDVDRVPLNCGIPLQRCCAAVTASAPMDSIIDSIFATCSPIEAYHEQLRQLIYGRSTYLLLIRTGGAVCCRFFIVVSAASTGSTISAVHRQGAVHLRTESRKRTHELVHGFLAVYFSSCLCVQESLDSNCSQHKPR